MDIQVCSPPSLFSVLDVQANNPWFSRRREHLRLFDEGRLASGGQQ